MMRRLIVCFGLLIATHAMGQVELRFDTIDINSALLKARAEKKYTMLFCYADWCKHCRYMKENVFCDAKVASYFQQHFYCVSQNMEKGKGPELNKTIRIQNYPTFIFYSPEGEMLYRIDGELTASAFLYEGRNATTPSAQFPFLKKKFESDLSNSENCYAYLRALKKAGMDYADVVSSYFKTQTDDQLLSEVNWRIFSNGISDFDSRIFRFVLAHQAEYIKLTSAVRFKRKMIYEVKALLSPPVENSDSATYTELRRKALGIGLPATDSVVFVFDLKMWELTSKWNLYRQASVEGVDRYALNNRALLSDICVNFRKHISDRSVDKTLLGWTTHLLSLSRNYDNLLLCSYYNWRCKRPAEAKKLALEAKTLAHNAGWVGEEADKQLLLLK